MSEIGGRQTAVSEIACDKTEEPIPDVGLNNSSSLTGRGPMHFLRFQKLWVHEPQLFKTYHTTSADNHDFSPV